MLSLALAALLASAATCYAIGVAFRSPNGSFLRTKRGVMLLVVLAFSFVTLPPQLPSMDATLSMLGSGQSVLPGLNWPEGFSKGLYLALWLVTSVAAGLIGRRIWQPVENKAYDSSAASRVSSLLPLADTLPDALGVLRQANIGPKDVARASGDIRLAGSRLAHALPPSDGALYTMVAAQLPTSVAATVTGYLLEGAGRRSAH